MPPLRAARAASGCRAPGDSRQQTLDDTSAGIGANQVHRRAPSEGAEVPVQPASGLLPVGEGPLGDCQAPRHASGAIGLVDRKPAAVRPPVRQSTRLDDEGAQFAPGDAALSESVDRSYIPECPSLRMSRCPGCRACRAISDRISAWPLDKYELYLEEARRDLVGQNSLFRDLDHAD